MSVNVAANLLAVTEEQVIDYFKKKGALSTKNAIPLDFEDLKSKLDVSEFLSKDFSEFPYIKMTRDGKYFIEEIDLKKREVMIKNLLVVMGVIIFVPVILTLLGFLFSW